MTSEFKKKFQEELRSGKYKQCFSVLREEEDCFCATGLACFISCPEGWEGFKFFGFSNSLSPEALEKVEFDYHDATALYFLNDREKLTFDEIADRLDEGWIS